VFYFLTADLHSDALSGEDPTQCRMTRWLRMTENDVVLSKVLPQYLTDITVKVSRSRAEIPTRDPTNMECRDTATFGPVLLPEHEIAKIKS